VQTPVKVGGAVLTLGQTTEEHQLAVGRELWLSLAVQLPGRDLTHILGRADGLDEHSTTVLQVVAKADESQPLPIRRERWLHDLGRQAPDAALRSIGDLVRITPVEPDDKDRLLILPLRIRLILPVGRAD
jgi:hypothetical protein